MINGIKNNDRATDVLVNKKARQPVTLEIMLKLQYTINHSKLQLSNKRLIWFAATYCLLGSFRIHKVLPVFRHSFDMTTTLMAEDLTLTTTTNGTRSVRTLTYNVRNSKEDKSKHGIQVDVFENGGALNWGCAVKAYKKYVAHVGTIKPNQRIGLFQDGLGCTGRMFNSDIKVLLKGKIDHSLRPLTTHSFRAGMATMMARACCSDEQIQLAGRWSSDAFKLYIKTARPQRAMMAAEVWGRLSKCRAVMHKLY